jgi:cytochrome c5
MNIFKLAIYLLVSTFIIGPSYSVVLANEAAASDPAQLYEKKCSGCHAIERSKSKKKSGKAWRKTVMRMKNYNGCPITDKEAEMIIDHLTEFYGK